MYIHTHTSCKNTHSNYTHTHSNYTHTHTHTYNYVYTRCSIMIGRILNLKEDMLYHFWTSPPHTRPLGDFQFLAYAIIDHPNLYILYHRAIFIYKYAKLFRRCPLCIGYRRRKWTRRHEFKSWSRHCISHSTNTLRKGMNQIILPPAMGK